MGSPWYKIMLGMSYYIYAGGLGALVDGLRPVFKESTDSAVNVLVTLTFAVNCRVCIEFVR